MKSIVAFQLKRIGDLILTLPALETLRTACPKARISLVIDAETAGLAPAIHCVDRIMVYRKKSFNVRTFRRLILGRCDAALDFTGTDRSSLLTSLTKADRRIAFRWAAKNPLRSHVYTEFVDSPVREKHTIDHYLDLLSALEITAAEPRLQLVLPKSATAKVREVLQSRKIAAPFVVLHPGAARAEKYWPPERWAKVLEHCRNWQRPCVIIGGHSALEKAAIEEIRQQTAADFHDLSGKLNLVAAAALIAQAELFIGLDSGPSHLAAAAHTPQITLFGPTNPFHWRARHERSIVLQGGKKNPLQHFESHAARGHLNALSTEEVIHAINLLLRAAPPAPTSPIP